MNVEHREQVPLLHLVTPRLCFLALAHGEFISPAVSKRIR